MKIIKVTKKENKEIPDEEESDLRSKKKNIVGSEVTDTVIS